MRHFPRESGWAVALGCALSLVGPAASAVAGPAPVLGEGTRARIDGQWNLAGHFTQVTGAVQVGNQNPRFQVGFAPRCTTGPCSIVMSGWSFGPKVLYRKKGAPGVYEVTFQRSAPCRPSGNLTGPVHVVVSVTQSVLGQAERVHGSLSGNYRGCGKGQTASEHLEFDAVPVCVNTTVTVDGIKARSFCFTRFRRDGWWSRRTTRVAGIDMTPQGDNGRLMLRAGRVVSNGPVDAYLPRGPFGAPRRRWRLFSHHVNVPTVGEWNLALPEGVKIGGLEVKGAGSLSWKGRTSRLKLEISLGKDFKIFSKDACSGVFKSSAANCTTSGDASGGVKATLASSNDTGFRVEAFHLKIPVASVVGNYPIALKNLEVGMTDDGTTIVLDGSVDLAFPVKNAPTISGTVEFQIDPGYKLKKLGGTLKFAAPGKLLGEGIFLQSVGGSFSYPPVTVGLSADLTAGPEVPGLGIALVEADGELTLSDFIPWPLPPFVQARSFALESNVKIVGQKVAEGKLAVDGVVGSGSLQGTINDEQGFYKIKSDLNAWFTRTYAMGVVSSDLTIRTFINDLHFIGNGEVTLDGLGACFTGPGDLLIGFFKRWDEFKPHLIKGICDFSPIETGRPARARATGAPSVIASGTRGALFVAHGAGAPPHATLVGPDGTRIETPADQSPIQRPGLLVFADRDANDTYFVVAHPAAGSWHIEGDEVASTSAQAALPKVSVHATVSARGNQRKLTWRLSPIPGQRVTFAETGHGTARILGTTAKARGSLRFTPADAAAPAQRILAIVSQGGVTRQTLTVASYRFHPATLPPPRRVTVRRRGAAGTVLWTAVAGARGYDVTLLTGRTVVAEEVLPHGRSVAVSNFRGAGRARVRAIGRDGRLGRPATARIR